MLADKEAEIRKRWPKKLWPNIQAIIFASAFKEKTMKELLAKIAEVALSQPTMGEKLPTAYLSVEERIFGQRETIRPPILRWNRFCDMVGLQAVGLTKETLKDAVLLLYDLGSVVYFDDETAGLNDIVILDPQYLTELFASIISTKQTFIKKGILHHRDLDQMWREPGMTASF